MMAAGTWHADRIPRVDPEEVELCLTQLKSFSAVDPATAGVAEMRAAARRRQDAMNISDAPDCPVDEYRLDSGAGLRLYRPACADGAILIYIHGGGFVQGDLGSVDPQCRVLAEAAGAFVVSLDYRLAPEHRFPAACDDAVALAGWIADRAQRFGFDLDRVAVAGESSGGNLATVLAAHLAANGPFAACGQVLVYPVTDLRCGGPTYTQHAVTPTLTAARMRWFAKQYLSRPHDALDPRASPLLMEEVKGLPPTLLVVAGRDPLVGEGRAYAERLEQAGVAVTRLEFPDLYHGFWGWGRHLTAARELLALTAAFVRHATGRRRRPGRR